MSSTGTSTSALSHSIDRSLTWLSETQTTTGELEAHASALDSGPPQWVPDPLKFITALGAVALDDIDDQRARRVVDRAVEFLRREQETMAQWRYWAQSNQQFDFTPPDADDTACCSLAVATRGLRTGSNVPLLLGNRDGAGRFYTWLVPHRRSLDPRRAWGMRDEYRSIVKQRRDELWTTTEAHRDDVDAVVNTNVIRYLGPRRAPASAVEWVVSIINEGLEDNCDAWHRNRFTLYAAIADAHLRGVNGFQRVAEPITERIRERLNGDGSVGSQLDSALALLALQGFDRDEEARVALANSLIAGQADDGSWQRSIFYYGGPNEVFGWASEALTTAWATQALDRHRRNSR